MESKKDENNSRLPILVGEFTNKTVETQEVSFIRVASDLPP